MVEATLKKRKRITSSRYMEMFTLLFKISLMPWSSCKYHSSQRRMRCEKMLTYVDDLVVTLGLLNDIDCHTNSVK